MNEITYSRNGDYLIPDLMDLSRKVQSENTQNDFLIITAGFSSAAAEAVGKLETLFSTFPRLNP
jgi:hypothetical protein